MILRVLYLSRAFSFFLATYVIHLTSGLVANFGSSMYHGLSMLPLQLVNGLCSALKKAIDSLEASESLEGLIEIIRINLYHKD